MTVNEAPSIIIPAHNEEMSIRAGLVALLQDAEPGEFEVIVIANGCSDDTVGIAKAVSAELGYPVGVEDLPRASKTAALRLGDHCATGSVRVYLDADVLCPTDTMRAVVRPLLTGDADLVVPERNLDLDDASWTARKYYRIWAELPEVTTELSGRGCFAFSEAGRAEFDEFPDVTADDHWAVRQVSRDRSVVANAPISIRPPQTLSDLTRVRARVYDSNRIVHSAGTANESQVVRGAGIRYLARNPRLWLGGSVYAGLTIWSKLRGRIGGAGASLRAGRDSRRGTTGS